MAYVGAYKGWEPFYEALGMGADGAVQMCIVQGGIRWETW